MPPVPTLSEPQPFTYAAGDVIAGKYALEELIGSGGMGAVFRARNIAIDMPVALKLIRTDLDRELLRGRLLQEARAAAKLAHPAIVRVFDVGTTALGDPFIVMELLHGYSLAKLLEREGRLTSVRAVQLLLPIADALAIAHSKGFVHRDVKPDNVFIANDEEGQLQPKLVDFGIVKHELQNGDRQLTQIGAVLGSPDYMSPEQARGLDGIDHKSDIWSFAVVLYETICGVPPFQSTSYNALLRLIVEAEPLSLRDRQASDQELSNIVARGLSKDPGARFASIGQLGKALAAWLAAQGVNEDACGVSVEARWLSRTTDPSLPGRVSRSSIPDSWPAPPSGVRAVSGALPRHLGNVGGAARQARRHALLDGRHRRAASRTEAPALRGRRARGDGCGAARLVRYGSHPNAHRACRGQRAAAAARRAHTRERAARSRSRCDARRRPGASTCTDTGGQTAQLEESGWRAERPKAHAGIEGIAHKTGSKNRPAVTVLSRRLCVP